MSNSWKISHPCYNSGMQFHPSENTPRGLSVVRGMLQVSVLPAAIGPGVVGGFHLIIHLPDVHGGAVIRLPRNSPGQTEMYEKFRSSYFPPLFCCERGKHSVERNTWPDSHAQEDPFLSEPLIGRPQKGAGREAHKQWTPAQHARCRPGAQAAPSRRSKRTQLASQMGLGARSRQGTGRPSPGHLGEDRPGLWPQRDTGDSSADLCPFQVLQLLSETQFPLQTGRTVLPPR